MKANIEEEKKARKEKRQKKDKERRKAMRKPIAPLPAQEMCRYEQIREASLRKEIKLWPRANSLKICWKPRMK